MNEETEKKCEICGGSGWVPHSQYRSSREEYKIFKIEAFVECQCKKEAKPA